MIGVTAPVVIDVTGGQRRSCSREFVMAAQPLGPGSALPPTEWSSSAHIYTRGQQMACVRAGVIALLLLGILAFIVLF
jgi:hypothetical protein